MAVARSLRRLAQRLRDPGLGRLDPVEGLTDVAELKRDCNWGRACEFGEGGDAGRKVSLAGIGEARGTAHGALKRFVPISGGKSPHPLGGR